MNIPKNEIELIILFASLCENLGWEILQATTSSFPDAIIRNKESGELFKTEFEFNSSSFVDHNHNINECDLIICWKNDFPIKTGFPIWELSSSLQHPSLTRSLLDVNKILSFTFEFMKRREIKRMKKLENKLPKVKKDKNVSHNETLRDWRVIYRTLNNEDLIQLANLNIEQMKELAEKKEVTYKTIWNWSRSAKKMIAGQ